MPGFYSTAQQTLLVDVVKLRILLNRIQETLFVDSYDQEALPFSLGPASDAAAHRLDHLLSEILARHLVQISRGLVLREVSTSIIMPSLFSQLRLSHRWKS